jgi:hypothetical protein
MLNDVKVILVVNPQLSLPGLSRTVDGHPGGVSRLESHFASPSADWGESINLNVRAFQDRGNEDANLPSDGRIRKDHIVGF